MTTALDSVRVEVAFSADPDTVGPAFTDLTSRVLYTRSPLGITRGRQDEFDTNAPGRCTLTLDNTDGKLTPGNASAYANLKPQNRLRVTYRDPAVGGNFVDAESATFEGGTVGSWTGVTGATVANSALHVDTGTKAMLVTWPTVAGDGASASLSFAGDIVAGRSYTATARVYVPAGHPAVHLAWVQSGTPTYGAASAVTGAFTTISVTITAANMDSVIVVRPATAATAGQQVWVDTVRVDETNAPAAFTTTPITSVIVGRFDGYVDGWPTEWPGGGKTEATATVTAYDLQSRIARGRTLGSVIEETWGLNSPGWHFPLDEPADSTSAGDVVGTGSSLVVTQRGTGGALTFADGTGPYTDGGSAPTFAPVDVNNGLYLSGTVPQLNPAATGITLEATVNTTNGTDSMVVARMADAYGSRFVLLVSAGQAQAAFVDQFTGASQLVIGFANYADGHTHTLRASIEGAGTTKTIRLRVDGGTENTGTVTTSVSLPALSSKLEVGGTAKGGYQFKGVISHVAAFPSVLDATTSLEHHNAAATGFAGERSDQRISRIASWIGVPAGMLSLDVGQETIGHVASNDRNAWDYMQLVSDTEGGNLYVDTAGRIVMRNRAVTFDDTVAVTATVTADDIGPDTNLVNNLADIVNDVTVAREGGASFRVKDATSITNYGSFSDALTIAASSDGDAFDRANWLVAARSTPVTRLTELVLDALAGTAASAIRGLDIDKRVSVTGMPTQSSAASFDLRVLGYTESIGGDGWTVVANTAPFMVLSAFELDDAVRGLLDSNNRLGY